MGAFFDALTVLAYRGVRIPVSREYGIYRAFPAKATTNERGLRPTTPHRSGQPILRHLETATPWLRSTKKPASGITCCEYASNTRGSHGAPISVRSQLSMLGDLRVRGFLRSAEMSVSVLNQSPLDQFPELTSFLPGSFSVLVNQCRVNSQGYLLFRDAGTGLSTGRSAASCSELLLPLLLRTSVRHPCRNRRPCTGPVSSSDWSGFGRFRHQSVEHSVYAFDCVSAHGQTVVKFLRTTA